MWSEIQYPDRPNVRLADASLLGGQAWIIPDCICCPTGLFIWAKWNEDRSTGLGLGLLWAGKYFSALEPELCIENYIFFQEISYLPSLAVTHQYIKCPFMFCIFLVLFTCKYIALIFILKYVICVVLLAY